MSIGRLSFLLLICGTLGFVVPEAASITLKCSSTMEVPGHGSGPVSVVDGAIVSEAPSREAVARADVQCWNPETGEFDTTGIPVVIYATRTSYRQVWQPLNFLLWNQDEYQKRHGRYATSLQELRQDLLDRGNSVSLLHEEQDYEFSGSPDGWVAVGPKDDSHIRCFAVRGILREGLPPMTNTEVTCETVQSTIRDALQEYWTEISERGERDTL